MTIAKCVSVPCCAGMGKKAPQQPPPTRPAPDRGTAPTAAETSAAPPASSRATAALIASASSSMKPRKAGSAFSFGRALGGAGARAAQTVPTARTSPSTARTPAPARPSPSSPASAIAVGGSAGACPSSSSPARTPSSIDAGKAGAEAEAGKARLTAQQFVSWLQDLTEAERPVANTLLRGFDAENWTPLTNRQAAAMQAQAGQLTQQGETYKAHPLLCQLALYSMFVRGADSAESVRAVYNAVYNLYLQNSRPHDVDMWLLPRAVQHWGIGHPDTQRLVQHAALLLAAAENPGSHQEYSQLVTDIALQLPDGLGWGTAVVRRLVDEQLYNRHAVMISQATQLFTEGHFKQAKSMFQRCVAYCTSLGPHWLGSQRKLACMQYYGVILYEERNFAGAYV